MTEKGQRQRVEEIVDYWNGKGKMMFCDPGTITAMGRGDILFIAGLLRDRDVDV